MLRKNLLLVSLTIVLILFASFLLIHSTLENKANKDVVSTSSYSYVPKTIASNQWFSTIYKQFPTQPLFAFPLAYQITENGLGVSYPTVTKTQETIYGSYIQDFSIGTGGKLLKPTILSRGDWNINVKQSDYEGHSMTFSIAQGAPFTVVHTDAPFFTIRLSGAYEIYNDGEQKTDPHKPFLAKAFRIDIGGKSYAIILDKNTTVISTEKTVKIPTSRIFVGILDKPQNFTLFKQAASTEIIGTRVNWKINNNTLETTYAFNEGGSAPLIALLPHQSAFLKEKLATLGEYDSIRGKLDLVQANSFTTTMPLMLPEIKYSPLKNSHDDFINSLQTDAQTILNDNQPTKGDYFLGAWYGKAVNILLLAQAASLIPEEQSLIKTLAPRLMQSLQYFTYHKDVQSMIADKPEFGNEQLNDHHFHYGYYIRAASVLSMLSPSYGESVKDKIDQLVGDIATTDRNSLVFPFLRNFNPYEGHSYADGFANFGDGNNQESSSEAINAWYGVYLWAKATNNNQLKNTALYLLNTEILSTEYYWFGKNGEYASPYNHPVASLVWGGKVDFATWFSGKTNMKYGIQVLPFTPASFSYLGKLRNFQPYENDFLDHGGDIADEWGDLFVMLTSFYNPQKALSEKEKVKKPEANNPKSLFLYVLYRNAQQ